MITILSLKPSKIPTTNDIRITIIIAKSGEIGKDMRRTVIDSTARKDKHKQNICATL